jgi:hypothetical protein
MFTTGAFMKHPYTILAALLLMCTCAIHAQHGGVSVALPAVIPPEEVAEFDFLIGQWEIELTPKASGLAAMIHGAPRLLGTWKAWRAFDGFGIDDELRVIDASGNPVALTHSMRIYDKKAGHWLISGLDVYRTRFNSAVGVWGNGEIWIRGRGVNGEGKAYLSRTRFYEITEQAFSMLQDRSFDEGKSWEEASIRISAKRVAAKTAR